jgi:hypothetical protein
LIMAPFQPVEVAAQMRRRSRISRVEEVPRDTQFLAHTSVAIASAAVGDFERTASVKFDMGRNSITEHDREGPPPNIFILSPPPSSCDAPPNIDEHLPGEINDVTRRNEEILAEWDEHFDDHHSRGPANSFDERYNNLFFRLVSL